MGQHISGGARLPKDLMIGPEHLVASCRMFSVRLKTRRAVVNRWITARRVLRSIGVVWPRSSAALVQR
jgi:hypothetical protein